MTIFDQKYLNKKGYFLTYFSIGSLSWILGASYFNLSQKDGKWFVYFGSQMTIFFLIQYVLISLVYRKIFNRNLEFSNLPDKNIDIIPTLIIAM